MRSAPRALILAGLILAPPTAQAQPPTANARVDSQSAASGLAASIHRLAAPAAPAWIGYAVPGDARHSACCFDGGAGSACCGGCRLEGGGSFASRSAGGPVRLEGSARAAVLLRAEGGRIGRIRAFSEECPLDAGGLPLHWLTDVRPEESLALLATFLGDDRLRDPALATLAFHAGPAADAALIDVARHHASAHARGQALFWLAQRAGRRATEAITEALRDDPETEVKRKAVFALSQLPVDEGVPLLIRTARTNRNPEVRKQAMFWLGQSGDPRALAFFAEILGR